MNIQEHAYTPRPEITPGLHDNSPTVSVDINLGKKMEWVDFDYAAFDRQADRLGLPVEARSEVSVDILANGPTKWARGLYTPSEKLIEVKAGRSTNKTFTYELQHAADDANGIAVRDNRERVGTTSVALLPKTKLQN